MRVVGKEGALGAGVGGNCSSGMDGSGTITRRYAGRGVPITVADFDSRWGVQATKSEEKEKRKKMRRGGFEEV